MRLFILTITLKGLSRLITLKAKISLSLLVWRYIFFFSTYFCLFLFFGKCFIDKFSRFFLCFVYFMKSRTILTDSGKQARGSINIPLALRTLCLFFQCTPKVFQLFLSDQFSRLLIRAFQFLEIILFSQNARQICLLW